MNITNALAWTLIHFLWQGALVALLVAASLALFRRADCRTRYAIACVGMTLMLISAGVTLSTLLMTKEPIPVSPVSSLVDAATAIAGQSPSERESGGVPDYFPALLWMWFLGVVTLSIRSLGGWIVAERYT